MDALGRLGGVAGADVAVEVDLDAGAGLIDQGL